MKKDKVERPYYTPSCCNQLSKWVQHSVNLAYFYCEVCKKEVPEVSGVGGNDRWASLSERILDVPIYGAKSLCSPNLPIGNGDLLCAPFNKYLNQIKDELWEI